jgi:heparan sulfate N-deacetylase/N-sulfotransferase NDST2
LDPGNYASHLERWLNFYKPHQLHIVDGEELKYDPVSVLNRLQRSLGVQPFMDYANHLKFDRKKGFFCEVSGNGQFY